jgi:hypothetical protein
MHPAGKKFISLFLVFSLTMLSVNLYAKERRGAKLIVMKKDGQQIRGELITIKPNSLLLLDTEGKDASVGIVDIKAIKIENKSKFWIGARIGGFIGAIVGALYFLSTEEEDVGFLPLTVFSPDAILGGVIGVMFGGTFGVFVSADKTIQLEKMTDSEINGTLDYLRKKARIRDYK